MCPKVGISGRGSYDQNAAKHDIRSLKKTAPSDRSLKELVNSISLIHFLRLATSANPKQPLLTSAIRHPIDSRIDFGESVVQGSACCVCGSNREHEITKRTTRIDILPIHRRLGRARANCDNAYRISRGTSARAPARRRRRFPTYGRNPETSPMDSVRESAACRARRPSDPCRCSAGPAALRQRYIAR